MSENTDLREPHLRSVLKGVTYRILGTLTTGIFACAIMGDLRIPATITTLEPVSKIIVYYLHERAWQLVPRGSVRRLLRVALAMKPQCRMPQIESFAERVKGNNDVKADFSRSSGPSGRELSEARVLRRPRRPDDVYRIDGVFCPRSSARLVSIHRNHDDHQAA